MLIGKLIGIYSQFFEGISLWGGTQKWVCSTLIKGQRIQACSFKDIPGGLSQVVAAYRILGLRCSCCMSCLKN